MTIPTLPIFRHLLGATGRTASLRPAGLAALALAASLGAAGVAHGADRAQPPSAPTMQVAQVAEAAGPVSRTHSRAVAPASQPSGKERFTGAPRYQWGCSNGSPSGCW